MIVIVNYGMGNLGSIFNILKKVGAKAIISSKEDDIRTADKLILPGVGAFDKGVKNLKDSGLISILQTKVIHQKTPILGICLGMQLLTHKSEEGILPALGWIDAETRRFKFDHTQNKLKIPHMGWNTVEIKQQHVLFDGLVEEPRFYFVHSYHVCCQNPNDILTTTFYGFDFVSSVVRDNIAGVQFHPEKSHKFGMQLFKNFVEKF